MKIHIMAGALIAAASLPLAACNSTNQTVGAGAGGLIGGLVGSQFGQRHRTIDRDGGRRRHRRHNRPTGRRLSRRAGIARWRSKSTVQTFRSGHHPDLVESRNRCVRYGQASRWRDRDVCRRGPAKLQEQTIALKGWTDRNDPIPHLRAQWGNITRSRHDFGKARRRPSCSHFLGRLFSPPQRPVPRATISAIKSPRGSNRQSGEPGLTT